MAMPTDISSSIASSSSIEKENILIGSLNFLSRNLLLPTDVLRVVSEMDHDPTGDERVDERDVELLNHQLAAMQIQQTNNSSCSGIRKSLMAACFTTPTQRRPRYLSQLEANTFNEMEWIISRFGGKTIQTIAPIADLIRKRGVTGPHLIIAPEQVLSMWQREFSFWLPSMTTLLYDGPEHRKTIREGYSGNVKFDVLLTHYGMMIREREVLSKIGWYFLVVDGGHMLLSNRMRVPLDTTMKAYDYRSFIMVQNFFV